MLLKFTKNLKKTHVNASTLKVSFDILRNTCVLWHLSLLRNSFTMDQEFLSVPAFGVFSA